MKSGANYKRKKKNKKKNNGFPSKICAIPEASRTLKHSKTSSSFSPCFRRYMEIHILTKNHPQLLRKQRSDRKQHYTLSRELPHYLSAESFSSKLHTNSYIFKFNCYANILNARVTHAYDKHPGMHGHFRNVFSRVKECTLF